MKNKIYLTALPGLISLVFLLLLSPNLLPFNNLQAMDQYITHRITTKDGLPQNTIYDITQDKDGYIWIGTDEGVVRFDGIKFDHFNKLNTKNIKNNSITALFVSHGGTLWMGTFGGGVTLYDYKEKTFSSYTTQNSLSSDFIWIITQDREKNIWLGTVGGGIIRFKNNQFKSFTTKEGLSNDIINAIFEDYKGNLWIGTENGLNRLKDSAIKVYTSKDGIADNNVMSIFEDSRSVLWIGTINGLTAFKGNKFTTYTTSRGLSNNLVRAILEDRDNNLWIATDRGLSRICPSDRLPRNKVQIKSMGPGDEQYTNSFMKILEDREGNLWFGTSGQGITILHHRKLLSYTVENGLTRDHIKAIFQDRTGAMWIGTNGGGLNVIKDGIIDAYTIEHGLGSNFVNSICADEKNNIWIGTSKGLSLYKNETGTFLTYLKTKENRLSADSIRVLYEDFSGNLWIGTHGGGLNCFDKKEKKFYPFTTENGLSNNFILSIAGDKNNNLWIGTNKGLNRLKNNRFKSYTREDGLSNDMIYDIYPDSEEVIWIGTNGGGLNRFKEEKFTSYTTESGLFTNVIYRIIEDNKGNLWMSSNNGIFTVSIKELNQMARGKRSFLSCKYFGEEDGMKSAVCTGGFQPAGCKTKNGTLWFPTIKGIVKMDPKTITFNTLEPPVFIERFLADGMSRKITEQLTLPADTSEIKISFTALSYTAPRKVRFRYRLKGYGDKWTETDSREQVVYSDLPTGQYTFEVTACNNDGLWKTKRTALVFTIKPPFYETFWFYLIVASVLAFGGFWFYHLHERRIKQRAEKDRKYEASTLTPGKSLMYSQRLLKLIEGGKPFLDPDLSAVKLAEFLGISKKHLSQVINQQFHLNFKNFINKYRVEEAKKKLLDPMEQQFVLFKIALDVGFNSKSVFNEAFKKFTGMSPSEYRKKHT